MLIQLLGRVKCKSSVTNFIYHYSSMEIATSLSIAKHTVNTHRRNILSKSQCSTTAELIATSIREGWL
ncbi:MAG: response regulator transcription factor [Sphingobacteriales bacterium]|nr:MAG: response regulator transcription factor [Sphingobacteriales bacterium]